MANYQQFELLKKSAVVGIANDLDQRTAGRLESWENTRNYDTAYSFSDGFTIAENERQKVALFDGEWYRYDGDLPVTVLPGSSPIGNNLWKSVGDAALRSELANPDKGAAMVARGVVAVDSIADLLALPAGQRREDLRYLVSSYHAGWSVENPFVGPRGGGEFIWDASSSLAPDGVTIFGPEGLVAGRFRRLKADGFRLSDFGAVNDQNQDQRSVFLLVKAFVEGRQSTHIIVDTGTFNVSGIIEFSLKPGASLKITGESSLSCIRRHPVPPGAFKDFESVFVIRVIPGISVELEGFAIDSNYPNVPDAHGAGYKYEHSATIRFVGNAGNGKIKRFSAKNMDFYNPVADHIWCNVNNAIENFECDEIRSGGRIVTRSDITFSYFPDKAKVSNCNLDKLEVETLVNSSNVDTCSLSIDTCRLGLLDLGSGTRLANPISLSKVVTTMDTYIYGGPIQADKCTFRVSGHTFFLPLGSFSQCKFLIPVNPENNTVQHMYVRHKALESFRSVQYPVLRTMFDDCDFIIDHSGESFLGKVVSSFDQTPRPEYSEITFNDCRFDKRAEYSAFVDRQGSWRFTGDNAMGGSVASIYFSSQGRNSAETNAGRAFLTLHGGHHAGRVIHKQTNYNSDTNIWGSGILPQEVSPINSFTQSVYGLPEDNNALTDFVIPVTSNPNGRIVGIRGCRAINYATGDQWVCRTTGVNNNWTQTVTIP